MAIVHSAVPDWAKRVGALVADIEELESRLAEKKAELDSLGPQQAAHEPPQQPSEAALDLSRGGKREPGDVGSIGYTGRVFGLLKSHPFVRYTAGKVCDELKVSNVRRQATQIALMRLTKAGRIEKSDEGGYFFKPEGATDLFS